MDRPASPHPRGSPPYWQIASRVCHDSTSTKTCHVTYAKALSVRAVGLHAHHVRIEGAAVQRAQALQKRIRRGEIRDLQRQIRWSDGVWRSVRGYQIHVGPHWVAHDGAHFLRPPAHVVRHGHFQEPESVPRPRGHPVVVAARERQGVLLVSHVKAVGQRAVRVQQTRKLRGTLDCSCKRC